MAATALARLVSRCQIRFSCAPVNTRLSEIRNGVPAPAVHARPPLQSSTAATILHRRTRFMRCPNRQVPAGINPRAAAGFHDKLVIHSTAVKRAACSPRREPQVRLAAAGRGKTVAGGYDPSRAVLPLSRRRIGIVTVRPLGPPLTAWCLHQDLCVFVVIRTVDGVPYRGCLRNVPREGGVFGLHLPESAIWADQELFASHLFSPFLEHFQPPKDSRCPGSLAGRFPAAPLAAETSPRPSAVREFGAA